MRTKFLAIVLVVLFVFNAVSFGGTPPPVAVLKAVPNPVARFSTVILDGSGSYDPDNNIVHYEWDFDHNDVTFIVDYNEIDGNAPDGTYDGNTPHIYEDAGTYIVKLRVTDAVGWTDEADCTVYVTESTFRVDSNDDAGMAIFDDIGNLFLKGTLDVNSTHTATAADEFIIEDANSDELAIIDGNDGNMYIDGQVFESQSTLTPSGTNNFIIEDADGDTVAYIDDPNGDLYLMGDLYEEFLN
ncbi:MAG TPA: PKD domain-containing protein [bacterium]|nr:PKD domain-containing protein [bacterium]